MLTPLLLAALAAPPDDGFTPLFNGRDFAGWRFVLPPTKDDPKPDPAKTWSVRDGVIHCTGKPSGYLLTEREYADYTLRFRWKYPADIRSKLKRPNSGVLIHVTGPDRLWPLAIEAQLALGEGGDLWLNADADGKLPAITIDPARKNAARKDGRQFYRTGGPERSYENPPGEWNLYEITARGGDITFRVNGKPANEATGCALTKGRIALQSEGAEVEFKDVAIKPNGG
jgi:hypothetical protein